MVERIRTLLETRQLTPTQFADAIGVARPIVSHILSGRNKPSLEVVQRILAAMPDLSMPWLLNGTGSMQASAAAVAPVVPVVAGPPAQITAKEVVAPPVAAEVANPGSNQRPVGQAAPVQTPAAGAARPLPRRFTAPTAKAASAESIEADTPVFAQPEGDIAMAVQAAAVPVTSAAAAEPEPDQSVPAASQEPTNIQETSPPANAAAAALFADPEKPIRRIVIFYRDGSFADYRPE